MDGTRIIKAIRNGNIRQYVRDPFYSNSLFLMLSSAVAAIIGLTFWIVAGQFYSKADIGIMTVAISISGLISTISKLGLDQSLIRFIPEGDKSSLFSTFIIITTALSTFFSACAILIGLIWVDTTIPTNNLLLLIPLIILTTISTDICSAFTALRVSKYNVIHNILLSSRLALIIPLSLLGSNGMLLSFIGAYLISIVISAPFLIKQGIALTNINNSFLKKSLNFSIGSYASGLLQVAPNLIMPMLVFATLGASSAADFYIVFSFISMLSIIPAACNTSLFVEGSHGASLLSSVKKTILTMIALLTLASATIFFFGDIFLGLVGKDYTMSGLGLLRLMAMSSFPVAIFGTCIAILKTKNRLRPLILLSGGNCITLLSSSYMLSLYVGLNGIGYAWIMSHAISSIVGIWLVVAALGAPQLNRNPRNILVK